MSRPGPASAATRRYVRAAASSPTARLPRALALLIVLAIVLAPVHPSPAASAGGAVAPGRVIVKPGADRAAQGLRSAAAVYGATAVEDRPALGAQLWRVPIGREQAVADALGQRGDVAYAEPDRVLRLSLIPNDTYYALYQWNLPKIGAPEAWDTTTGDPGVVVAVIDSGIDPGHPDAPANLRLGCDYVAWGNVGALGACPPVAVDANGHGTHVAGIVAARQNNALGISGLAPSATLLAIRTADENGASYLSDVSAAILEAAGAGARVVNLSLGGTETSRTMADAVASAQARGVLLVAAAGNEYGNGNPAEYPAAYPGVLAVGSVTVDDRHASYSNVQSYVRIVAPGGDPTGGERDPDPTHWIPSLYPRALGGYAQLAGTSQAAPHVAAVAALVLSRRPSLTSEEVVALLTSTARPLGGTVPNPTFGYGQLDAAAAVRAALACGGAPGRPGAAPSMAASIRIYLPMALRNACAT